MKALAVSVALMGAAVVSAPCGAWEFRCRWVERVGTQDVLPPTPGVIVSAPGEAHRLRLQFGVFDDSDGAAPAGGFIGWNFGTLSVSGASANSRERRTPGRLAPFNFAAGPNSNGNPPPPTLGGPDAPGFDFQMLTEIDSTLGTQALAWLCGQPDPPRPVIRGVNTFVSLYEITVMPNAGAESYTVTAGGNLVAAMDWRVVGDPPDEPCCDPDCDFPVTLTYAPFALPPEAFSCAVQMVVPGPGAGLPVGVGVMLWFARRRRRS